MGCWNQTCGITQLHITAGEKVMVFPLVQSPQDNLRCTTPYWTPFPISFVSHYNDYGAGEDSSGLGLDAMLKFLKNNLVEVEQGDNKYHDIPVKREGFDENKFWEAIHEQRLSVKARFGEEFQVGMVMIKHSIVEYILEHQVYSRYEGYDRETGTSKYTEYKFADVLASAEAILDKMFEQEDLDLSELGEEQATRVLKQLKVLRRARALEQAASDVNDSNERNWAASWLRHGCPSHLRYSAFSTLIIDDALLHCVDTLDRDTAREILTSFLTTLAIDEFLMETRKFWSPQAGAGSQSMSESGYRLLMSAMTKALDDEKAEWEADELDEHDDEVEE